MVSKDGIGVFLRSTGTVNDERTLVCEKITVIVNTKRNDNPNDGSFTMISTQ